MKCYLDDCQNQAIDESTLPKPLPYPICDDHFAWLGMALVKPVPQWKRFLRTVRLFSQIVWRECEGGRLDASTAWEVSAGVNEFRRGAGEITQ